MQHYRYFYHGLDGRHPVPLSRDAAGALQNDNRQVHSRVLTPLNQAATTYSAAVHHVGNAKLHRFFIRYPHEEIGQQFKCLILSMEQYLLTMPALKPDRTRTMLPPFLTEFK